MDKIALVFGKWKEKFVTTFQDANPCCYTDFWVVDPVLSAIMSDDGIAKILALKAFLLVKQSAPQEHDELRAKAKRAVEGLVESRTVEGLRRRVFYNLILSELFRNTDPIPYRTAAMEDGELLSELGCADPLPVYMRIVEATTERLTTAHFGDFKSSPDWSHSSWSNSPLAESQAFRGNRNIVITASQIEETLLDKYKYFLQVTSLDEIMEKHGIV